MSHDHWPTFEEIAQAHGIPLNTIRHRYGRRKAYFHIEVWRNSSTSAYRVNPDDVSVLTRCGNDPPWGALENLVEEYTFMRSFFDRNKALRHLSKAYGRHPQTILKALHTSEISTDRNHHV